jgi:opacity protein-like surface antigen
MPSNGPSVRVGLSYAVGANTDLTLAYRYMEVVDPSFEFGQAATFDFDGISNRTLSVGLRWNFSTAANS